MGRNSERDRERVRVVANGNRSPFSLVEFDAVTDRLGPYDPEVVALEVSLSPGEWDRSAPEWVSLEPSPGFEAVEPDPRDVDRLLTLALGGGSRAECYKTLRREPWHTANELADMMGVSDSTARELLARLSELGVVERRKRDVDRRGANPYEYAALPPARVADRIHGAANAIANGGIDA